MYVYIYLLFATNDFQIQTNIAKLCVAAIEVYMTIYRVVQKSDNPVLILQ